MNIERADLFTVIQFDTKELFVEKLKMSCCGLNDISNLKDKKYQNTSFWYLCKKAVQKNNKDMNLLIRLCMEKKPNIDLANIMGNTVRNMLLGRGSNELKEIVLEGE